MQENELLQYEEKRYATEVTKLAQKLDHHKIHKLKFWTQFFKLTKVHRQIVDRVMKLKNMGKKKPGGGCKK